MHCMAYRTKSAFSSKASRSISWWFSRMRQTTARRCQHQHVLEQRTEFVGGQSRTCWHFNAKVAILEPLATEPSDLGEVLGLHLGTLRVLRPQDNDTCGDPFRDAMLLVFLEQNGRV